MCSKQLDDSCSSSGQLWPQHTAAMLQVVTVDWIAFGSLLKLLLSVVVVGKGCSRNAGINPAIRGLCRLYADMAPHCASSNAAMPLAEGACSTLLLLSGQLAVWFCFQHYCMHIATHHSIGSCTCTAASQLAEQVFLAF
jgi:hypothetical protein